MRTLNGAVPITRNAITETHCVVRKVRVETGVGIDQFLDILQRQRFTGKITIDLVQGSPRSMLAEDSKPLTA